jgi:hypothetical protein
VSGEASQDGRVPGRATSQDFAAWLELNPDTRAHLWLTCSMLVDELRMELDAADADRLPWEVELAPFGFAEGLPAARRGSYDAYTALALTHALDAVIWKLGNQPGAQPSCTMEALAMRAILERAAILVEELQEVLDGGEQPWWDTGHDPGVVDLQEIPDPVFQDLDHEMLTLPAAPRRHRERPAARRGPRHRRRAETEAARALGQDTLHRCRRALGPDHPITLYLTQYARGGHPMLGGDGAADRPSRPL